MNRKIIIFLILLLAFMLRFYKLGSFPALNADEAAIGYNAYSLLETGKDEHGNPWPIHFQSFNDYKPGLYFYLVIPFVKFLGLSEWSVRTPNALLGVATVYVLYLLVKELRLKKLMEIVAPAMLAISPWHIHFSRGGWEVNTSTFFITLGTLLFLKYTNSSVHLFEPEPQNRRPERAESVERSRTMKRVEGSITILFLSTIAFSLSLYTYHSARIITPLLLFGLIGVYFDVFKANFKHFLLAGLLCLVALLPLVKDLVRPEISSRAAGVGLLADSGPFERVNEQRGEHGDFNSPYTKTIHNKVINYSLRYFQNYSDHFHGLFLFLSGDDIERNKVPETGQMYMTDLIFVIIGIFWMFKNIQVGHPEQVKRVEGSQVSKSIRVIVHWLLIAPVAAALTFQSPHALRSHNMVIPLIIISTIGFCIVLEVIKKHFQLPFRTLAYFTVYLLTTLSFMRYLHMYYNHMAQEYPYSSQYGVKELVRFVSENKGDFDKVIVTTRYDQPYILFLFYQTSLGVSDYTPVDFQQGHILTPRDKYGFSTVPSYNMYTFKEIDWDNDKVNYPNSLIVGTKEEIPKEANIVKKIYGSNGFEYFDIVAN